MANHSSWNFGETSDGHAEAGFGTLTHRVYRVLRGEILQGVRPPGSRLVRRTLGKQLGVSPNPVAEALWRLEQDGLVESQPMYGARVKPLTVENVRNDHILREAIECQAARLCAESANGGQLQELRAKAVILDEMLAQSPRPKEADDRHLDFHVAVARVAGAQALVDLLGKVWFRRLNTLNTANVSIKPVPADWHGQLVDALATHDPERAEAVMRHHVRYGVPEQLQALRAAGSGSSGGGL